MIKSRLIFFVLYIFILNLAHAEYVARFLPPSTQDQARIAAHMRQTGTLENLTTLINRAVTTSREVPIIAKTCGVINAFYSPDTRQITLCYELLVDREMRLHKSMGNRYTDAQYMQFLYSEVAFVLLHEMGHQLIHEYSIPVLGREEDAADKIAAYVFLTSGGEKVMKRSLTFFANKTSIKELILNGSTHYGDEHSLNEQRLANLICLGSGKDATEFGQLAFDAKLPQTRLVRCRDEYEKMVRDIPNLFGNKVMTSNINGRSTQSIESTSKAATTPFAANANKCTSCHAEDRRLIGPSLKEIAGRYGPDELTSALTKKIKLGSTGIWGPIPAPPLSGIDTQTVSQLASWISTYK
jgi:cytochrome c551/c552